MAGVAISGGYVVDTVPSLRKLSRKQLRFKIAEAVETDPEIATALRAIEQVCRSVPWRVDPSTSRPDGDPEAQAEADFVEDALGTGGKPGDMSHRFADLVDDALGMVPYGFAFCEVVWKLRLGPDQADPARRSAFSDGRIAPRKIVGRDQLTLERWQQDETGGVQGFVQLTPFATGGRPTEVTIPIERGLLFRTTKANGDPEGRSVIRPVLETWVEKRFLEQQEGVGTERDLTGLPVVYGPKEVMGAPGAQDPDPKNLATFHALMKIARDLKFNEQGALGLSSETYPNPDGSPSNIPKFKIDLLRSPGQKAVDTAITIARKQAQIFRSVFVQFLLLGSTGRGALNLAESATDFFVLSVTHLLDQIADVLNRHLLPRLWELNALDPGLMPTIAHDDPSPQDMAKLAAFITAMSAAGDPLGADDEGANWGRRLIGAPERVPQDPRDGADLPGDPDSGEEPAVAQDTLA